MKKVDLYPLRAGLRAVGKYKGVKFAYAVAKNLRLVDQEIADMEKAREPSEEFQKFEREKMDLSGKFAKLDEKGKPITVGQPDAMGRMGVLIEDVETFNKEYKELVEKYNGCVKEQDEKEKEFKKFIEETDAGVHLHTIKEEVLPQDITPDHLGGILDIIEE